jgi:hypothetical protein
MKKLVCSAIALSLASVSGFATESEDVWGDLDSSFEQLTASPLDTKGPNISGYIMTDYTFGDGVYSQVIDDGDGGTELADTGGFNLPNARLAVKGERGDYSYKLQYNFAGSGSIKDIYVRFPIGGSVQGQLGNFKSDVLRSGLLSSANLFFQNRTANGSAWASRDLGFRAFGQFDRINWSVAIQNGGDGVADEYLTSARATLDFLDGGVGKVEGSHGEDSSPSGTVGVAFFEDGSVDDGDGFAADVHIATNVYSFGAEMVSLGDAGTGVGSYGSKSAFLESDSSPVSLQGTYMLSPDAWEVGIRLQDHDNEIDSSTMEVALNRYLDGHKLKWTIFIESYDSDADGDAGEGERGGVGLTLQF